MNKSILLLNALIIWNLMAFMLMLFDKKKAINRAYRISEKTLILSAFLLGSLGILTGMYVFRHKTKHIKFKILVPVSVIVNVILYYFLFQMVSGIGITHY